jgi:proline iminopeptidase
MKWMSTQVKNGKYLYCPNGSHLAMYDDQLVFLKGVVGFIKEVDGRK